MLKHFQPSLASLMLFLFVIVTITTTTTFAFSIIGAPCFNKKQSTSTSSSSSSLVVLYDMKEPTDKQKEQIDKFGMTPETSFEMLFDHLGQAQENDPVFQELTNDDTPGGEQWKEFLNNMKQMKQAKQQQQQEEKEQEDEKPDE